MVSISESNNKVKELNVLLLSSSIQAWIQAFFIAVMCKSIAGKVSFDLTQKEISAVEFINLRQVLCLARKKDLHLTLAYKKLNGSMSILDSSDLEPFLDTMHHVYDDLNLTGRKPETFSELHHVEVDSASQAQAKCSKTVRPTGFFGGRMAEAKESKETEDAKEATENAGSAICSVM